MTPQALIAVPPHEQPLITPSELRPLLTQSETPVADGSQPAVPDCSTASWPVS
ncbi:hypothetical protein WH47_02828 [Habropoda laboriosa]|uniref:Uncharacterized protein n=1 Tax=Habropoda laboriosa TaxID=597456 RepID=A0A0L7RHH6_9HYME|nr:hypothetical protein WH47_02828 [Habropoda laboriosa]